jgi:hypothetical protein
MKDQSISLSKLGMSILPSILIALQFSQVLGKMSSIVFPPIILIVGGYLIAASYKKFGVITNLELPTIGTAFLELWILSRWVMSPHSSLLLIRWLFVILTLPSFFVLYGLRFRPNKLFWFIFIFFVASLVLVTNDIPSNWRMLSINMIQWIVFIIPLFALCLFLSVRYDISLSLALVVFMPFWINYNLDALGIINNQSSVDTDSSIKLALVSFQLIPIVVFLIVLPISTYLSSALNILNWQHIILALLVVISTSFIRFEALKEASVTYLFPLWQLIGIYTIILWSPILLPLTFSKHKNMNVASHS